MTTFSWNGFSLNNSVLGWRVLNEGSKGLNISYTFPETGITNSHGIIPARGYAEASTYKIVIGTLTSTMPKLVGLFQRQLGNTLTYNSLIAENVQVIGINPSREGIGEDPYRKIEITVMIPGVWFRGELTDYSFASVANGASVNVFPDISGAISDAKIILELSAITNARIVDVGTGTTFRIDGARTGIFRIDSSTGLLYSVASTSSWSGGTEQTPSGYTPPLNRGVGFEISPVTIIESSQPRSYGQIQYFGSGAANIFVRGRNAHTI